MIARILNAYSGEEAKGSSLRFALRLAKERHAEVFGVLRHDMSYLETAIGDALPESLRTKLRELDVKQVTEIGERFRRVAEECGFSERIGFADLRKSPEFRVADIAAFHDVVVMGRHSTALHEAHLSARPDLVALNSGTPVIVVPPGYDATVAPRVAAVIWDGSVAAVRALKAVTGLFPQSEIVLAGIRKQGRDVPGGGVEAFLSAHGHPVRRAEVDAKLAHDPAVWTEVFGSLGTDMVVSGLSAPYVNTGGFADRLLSNLDVPCLAVN